ncbi:MAG: GNAT family N-acetyltransferase [Candidatus Marinimicrobia bacterium]|nr:GNAT family N-acetyltransferase [Candidatus Neomarinimicrobiota bacterium]
MEIKRVDADIVRPLRQKVLRPGQPFHTTKIEKDENKDTVHYALYLDNFLTSIATIYPEPLVEYNFSLAYRLRGMATDPEYQGKGFGAQILKQCIMYLRDKTDTKYLWCNARESAFGFYEKFGFEIIGDIFEIENIGPHKKGFYLIRK